MQGVEPVKLKEIVKARSVYFSLRFAVFIGVLHPELRRHGHLQKVAEVFSLAMNLKPIAQILARLASIVFVGLQLVRKPCRMDIDEAQGELTALALAGLVDVWYVVENIDILHNLLILVSRELISLAVEPQRMVAHRMAAQRVALARAYHSLGKLLLFVRLAILMSSLPLFLLLCIEVAVSLFEFEQAVYIISGLCTGRRIRKAKTLVAVERLVHLVELRLLLAAISFFDHALTHEYRVVVSRVLDGHLTVFYVGYPLYRVPMQRINVSLGDFRAECLKFGIGKLVF